MDALTIDKPEFSRDAVLTTATWQRNGTRLLVATAARSGTILDHLDEVHHLVQQCLYDQGAILFRGFAKGQIADLRDFAASFGHELLAYEFGSTPRTRIATGVYSSTEYPSHQWIPQHNEQAYTLKWPMKIWFYCDVAAPEGGETPITNSRELYRRIDPAIRRRFAEKKLLYVRNYGNGLDLPWEQVFQTSERAAVEAFCRTQQIAWEWLADEGLRTRQICQSEAQHPVTGAMVWFNQAHLFHLSSLEPEVRASLLAVVDEVDLPRNVYYGDGTPIEDSILDDIRGLYGELMLSFRWQEGDILLLDNMLTAHGRAPFKGPRRIVVAMAESWPMHGAGASPHSRPVE
jgi:alpha-ketoglutarate-dependent taurine dioxygenase